MFPAGQLASTCHPYMIIACKIVVSTICLRFCGGIDSMLMDMFFCVVDCKQCLVSQSIVCCPSIEKFCVPCTDRAGHKMKVSNLPVTEVKTGLDIPAGGVTFEWLRQVKSDP
jgi:hypothetical protein